MTLVWMSSCVGLPLDMVLLAVFVIVVGFILQAISQNEAAEQLRKMRQT